MKRTFVMLAQVYEKKRVSNASHYLASEKLDGVRVYWDGGISRGLLADDVPYANTTKDFRRLAAVRSTGLWSRYGKTIQAHPTWIDQLPVGIPLDGELFIDRRMFQSTVSISKGYTPIKSEWERIKFMAFDSPSYEAFATAGVIKETHHEAVFDDSVRSWILARGKSPNGVMPDLEKSYQFLTSKFPVFGGAASIDHGSSERVWVVEQINAGNGRWENLYDSVLELGGEGVMLRSRMSPWLSQRSWNLLKVKPSTEAIAEVIGWRSGRLTDKDSRWLGMIGSLVVRWDGIEFMISGFNENERGLLSDWGDWAQSNPDQRHPVGDGMKMFSLGDKIPFRYSELSVDGVPLKATYLRK